MGSARGLHPSEPGRGAGGRLSGEPTRTATVRVRRLDRAARKRPHWQTFDLAVRPGMSLLDGLFEILERQDPALAFRYSCGAGVCGSCAMVVDGREVLACLTRLETLGSLVSVEPLRNLPVVKDLVVDMEPFFQKHRAVTPYFVPTGAVDLAIVPPSLREIVDRQLDCITCGACFSACPIVSSNQRYLGPAALNRAYCLVADVRDGAGAERLATAAGEDGAFCCRNVRNCLDVCPRQIEPMHSIQRLRARALSAPGGEGPR